METKAEAQRFRGIIVSTPSRKTARSKPTVAISSDVFNYVQVTEAQLRWLIEDAGPKALEMLRDAA